MRTATFCRYRVAGRTPSVAPDAMAVPFYADAAARAGLRIGAHAGIPIRDAPGELFGTLCGFHPEVHGDDLLRHAPLLALMAGVTGRSPFRPGRRPALAGAAAPRPVPAPLGVDDWRPATPRRGAPRTTTWSSRSQPGCTAPAPVRHGRPARR